MESLLAFSKNWESACAGVNPLKVVREGTGKSKISLLNNVCALIQIKSI